MAVGVVEMLEVVEVAHHDHERLADVVLEVRAQKHPVHDARELVDHRDGAGTFLLGRLFHRRVVAHERHGAKHEHEQRPPRKGDGQMPAHGGKHIEDGGEADDKQRNADRGADDEHRGADEFGDDEDKHLVADGIVDDEQQHRIADGEDDVGDQHELRGMRACPRAAQEALRGDKDDCRGGEEHEHHGAAQQDLELRLREGKPAAGDDEVVDDHVCGDEKTEHAHDAREAHVRAADALEHGIVQVRDTKYFRQSAQDVPPMFLDEIRSAFW